MKHWIIRVLKTHEFHINRCRERSDWTVGETATALNRSHGSISEDLLLASFLKTHEIQLSRMSTMRDALEFVRKKKKEMKLAE